MQIEFMQRICSEGTVGSSTQVISTIWIILRGLNSDYARAMFKKYLQIVCIMEI
jgi:hypothetical protein